MIEVTREILQGILDEPEWKMRAVEMESAMQSSIHTRMIKPAIKKGYTKQVTPMMALHFEFRFHDNFDACRLTVKFINDGASVFIDQDGTPNQFRRKIVPITIDIARPDFYDRVIDSITSIFFQFMDLCILARQEQAARKMQEVADGMAVVTKIKTQVKDKYSRKI